MAALLAMSAVWILEPAAVPIYDGIGNPDEPYRWVTPPAGAKATPLPTIAQATVPADGGRSLQSVHVNSSELGPQVSLYLPALSLRAPTDATTIKVTVTPLAPTSPLPTDGRIVTNVYRIAATTPQGPAAAAEVTRESTPVLQMRAPTAKQPGPVLEHLENGHWSRFRTARFGVDIYQGYAPALGDWALVELRRPAGTTGGGGGRVGLLLAGVPVLAVGGLVIAVRMSRQRRREGGARGV